MRQSTFVEARSAGRPGERRLPILLAASVGAVVTAVLLTGSPVDSSARTWHVPGDASTIQAAINWAQAGDDILVAPGTYPEHDIVMKGGVLVHSEQGAEATIVDAQNGGSGFTCVDFQQEATLEGLTIMNGRSASRGGGVRCVRAAVVIQDCTITECIALDQGGGVHAEESSVLIVRSEISENGGTIWAGGIGGVHSSIRIVDSEVRHNGSWSAGGVFGDALTHLSIERCVIVSNFSEGWCGGVFAMGTFEILDCVIVRNTAALMGDGCALWVTGTGSIVGCTLAANRGWSGDPYVVELDGADVSLERTTVAFHEGGEAFLCMDSEVSFRCCNVYGCGSNEMCGDDLGGNFSADPLFCDMEADDYTLNAESLCLPGNHPSGVDCGLIGALGPGCGSAPPTGACCLQDGSCVVETEAECLAGQGSYEGDLSPCEPNPCTPTPVEVTTWGRIKARFH